MLFFFFFFSSRRRHTRSKRDWSSDVCSSDLVRELHHRHDGAVRLGAVVEVRAHVLQAGGGIREKSFLRQRHAGEFAGAGRRSEERRVGKGGGCRWGGGG